MGVGEGTGVGVAGGGVSVGVGDTCHRGDYLSGSCSPADEFGEKVFKWKAPASASYEIDTEGSNNDAYLYVLKSKCTGTELACDQNSGQDGSDAKVTISTTKGQTYFLVVDTDGQEHSCGPFILNITKNP